jgi:hypothetical protein
MSELTTSLAFKTLKATLDNIITDKSDNVESMVVAKKYFQWESMSDNYVDDLEVGGPGLLTERDEGQALEVGTIYEGPQTRYISRKFGRIIQYTEELEEDSKYLGEYVGAAKRLKRAAWKTVDVDAANVLNRAANSAYVGGDGFSLANSAHTIPGGGTFSNTLSTPMSPSRTALITVMQNLAQTVGHDGLIEGFEIKKVVAPPQQKGVWMGILGSTLVPDSANNEINVAKGMGELVIVKFWTASTTNWGVTTDAPDGLKLKFRRRPRSRTWVDEPTEIINHGISARWARGWSDARGFYFSNA